MGEEKIKSRKSSTTSGDSKEIKDKENGDGEVALKAKMSLLNGCTVIVGSIIGELSTSCCFYYELEYYLNLHIKTISTR